MWRCGGEEPPLHTHSREDELLYVVQGKLIARVGMPVSRWAGRLRGSSPRCAAYDRVVGDQATLLLSFGRVDCERFLVPRKGTARSGPLSA